MKGQRILMGTLALVLLLALSLRPAPIAHAATITVNSTIVTLSGAKGLVLTSENEILRRFAPQNDTAMSVLDCQSA